MDRYDPITKTALAASIAQICQDEGVETVNMSSVEILSRLAAMKIHEAAEAAAHTTKSSGRLITNTSDMSLALSSLGVSPYELAVFLENHSPSTPIAEPPTVHVPTTFPDESSYPPGSIQDVVPFPPHIPPYMPPLPPDYGTYSTLISQDQTQLNKRPRH